jgi:hypothetical protein
VALVVPGGGVLAAAGVAGGALLAILSYLAIKRGVGAMADAILARGASEPASGGAGGRRPAVRVWAGMFVLRHALLAGIAYVMIARLRLPPVALLGGASVIVLAAAAELIGRRPPH